MTGLVTLPEARALLQPGQRLLALDLGAKTIGLAAATWPDGVPTPVGVIRRTRFQADAGDLIRAVAAERAALIVLGLPLHMGGAEGRRAQGTRAFARNLQRFEPPPILLFDERLTTAEAEDRMRAAGVKAGRRAEIVDAAAAVVILESAMAALASLVVHGEGS